MKLEDVTEGWYEWFKMPNNTTHIAYVGESYVYIPEQGLTIKDFGAAYLDGKAYRLVREEAAKEKDFFEDFDVDANKVVLVEVGQSNLGDMPEEPFEIEWRPIDKFGWQSFEINQYGAVRNKRTKKILDSTLDPSIDNMRWKCYLTINGVKSWVDGPELAKRMWGNDGNSR